MIRRHLKAIHKLNWAQQMRPAYRTVLIWIFSLSFLASSQIASGESIDQRLANFLGRDANAVTSIFGEPFFVSPTTLAYRFNQAEPNIPHQPTPLNPRQGATGTGVISPSTFNQAMPCELRFTLDDSAQVSSADHHGPGCFEIVYSRTKNE